MLLIDKMYREGRLDDIALTQEDLIMSCSYNTKSCNDSAIQQYYSPVYGYCYTFNDIADDLFLSVNTVKSHLQAIYRKLGAGTRQEAVRRARELGLI